MKRKGLSLSIKIGIYLIIFLCFIIIYDESDIKIGIKSDGWIYEGSKKSY